MCEEVRFEVPVAALTQERQQYFRLLKRLVESPHIDEAVDQGSAMAYCFQAAGGGVLDRSLDALKAGSGAFEECATA